MPTEGRPSPTHEHPQLTGPGRDIVDAAEALIRERGLAAATTRAIAERAGCSEGLIYRYFPDKAAVLMAIVASRFPDFLELMHSLPGRAGSRTVRRNLEQVAIGYLAFSRVICPMIAGAMAQRDLTLAQREWFLRERKGPLHQLELVTTYLREEQRLGRVRGEASPQHAARLLLGTCFAQSFLTELMGDAAKLGSDERFAKGIVGIVMEGLEP
ncbi:MAG: TetR/AcrR family transcriptional regulator [Actinobacteria bacterium]|nr:TetR/AcrR family transcriptional regulator [Actinomycetota bacterium]